jgi:hypothetical protein
MNIVLMLIGVVIVYKVISVVYRKKWDENLSTDVSFSHTTATKDDKVEIIETVVNAKKLPVFCMNVKFDIDRSFIFGQKDTNSMVSDKTYRNDVFSLLSNQKVTRRIEVECSRRGVYRLEAVEMVFPGAFMNEILIHKSRLYSNITVFPKPAATGQMSDVNNMIMGELERRKYLSEDRFVFAGIRDYQSYDSIRDINWNAYARTGSLMVNHYNETVSRNVCLLLNLESEGAYMQEDIVEQAISIAAGLSQLLAARGVNVSMVSNGRDIDTKQNITIKPGSGLSHFNKINMELARIDISQDMDEFSDMITALYENNTVLTDGMGMQNDMVYVLISANKNDRIKKAARVLMDSQFNKIWIVPQVISGTGSMYYENVLK